MRLYINDDGGICPVVGWDLASVNRDGVYSTDQRTATESTMTISFSYKGITHFTMFIKAMGKGEPSGQIPDAKYALKTQ